MSTFTIEIENDAKAVVERVASERNLSAVDFVKVAIAQSLAHDIQRPALGIPGRSFQRQGFW